MNGLASTGAAIFTAAIVLGSMPGWMVATIIAGTALWVVFRPH